VGVVLDILFLRTVCVWALISLALSIDQVSFSYAGSRNIGDVGDACLSVFDCQAHGGLYCDKHAHICKELPQDREVLSNPNTFHVQGCKSSTDCRPGWECLGYMCGSDARGCHTNADCLPHQLCVPDHPEAGSHSTCYPEDVAQKNLD
jgi:hypothetical protein